MLREWQRGDYLISTDRSRLDIEFIHQFLSTNAYWAIGRSLESVTRSIDNSLNFGLFKSDQQIGFARIVTDYATFAWLADVFVIPEYRGSGLGKWLIATITSIEELSGLRRWLLATRDAHDLYRQFGFNNLSEPHRWMERHQNLNER
jgi:GNAT superfamily N-acetyltransferase